MIMKNKIKTQRRKAESQLHFLAGLPRSGSTLLAAILNQNPAARVSSTSDLVHILDVLANLWANAHTLSINDPERTRLVEVMRGVINAEYKDTPRVVIDKSREWPRPDIMQSMPMVLGRPMKIIATVRDVPDCAASFARIADPEDLNSFLVDSSFIQHLQGSYVSLQNGYAAYPEAFLFVEYEDLLADPQAQLDRVHDFLDLPPFAYDFENIDGSTVAEDDAALWNAPGLHDVQPKLERQHNQSARDVLGKRYAQFAQPAFWRADPGEPEIHTLDLQLAAARVGNFAQAWELSEQLAEEEPENDRAAYNRGWYLLRQGKLQKGFALLDRGRKEGVFGNKNPGTPQPLWDGKSQGTVMLYLEGGLGDQIHQVRYAKNIAARGCKVVVACSDALVLLFNQVKGVSAIVTHAAALGVYHDFWTPGMSALVPLGYEYRNVCGSAYIPKPFVERTQRKRIGLRWSGNPRFEHEQHRVFPPELMFEAVKGIDADFICLQRDNDMEVCPDWVTQVPLDDWLQTQEAIASCDLVITSCTSVSHLAAAMGIETWVVQPIMPYYLYARPGDKTAFYDNMRLYRQERFDEWDSPFININSDLKKEGVYNDNMG